MGIYISLGMNRCKHIVTDYKGYKLNKTVVKKICNKLKYFVDKTLCKNKLFYLTEMKQRY